MVKYYSQFGEDRILEKLFEIIGTQTNSYAVEFGAGDGYKLSNIRHFIDNGWDGLQIDIKSNNTFVKNEHITAENINELFKKYKVPESFDLLSIDIDGNDYWVWKSLNYLPRVICIEFNTDLDDKESITIKYDPDHKFDKTIYHGASYKAMLKLGREKKYVPIFKTQNNLIFVRDIIFTLYNDKILNQFTLLNHIKKPNNNWSPDKLNRKWVEV